MTRRRRLPGVGRQLGARRQPAVAARGGSGWLCLLAAAGRRDQRRRAGSRAFQETTAIDGMVFAISPCAALLRLMRSSMRFRRRRGYTDDVRKVVST